MYSFAIKHNLRAQIKRPVPHSWDEAPGHFVVTTQRRICPFTRLAVTATGSIY